MQQRYTDHGFDDLGDHERAVVDEREEPFAVAVDDVGRVVGVPFEIERVPDHGTGEDVADKAENRSQQRTENCGDKQVGRFVLREPDIAENAAESENRKG